MLKFKDLHVDVRTIQIVSLLRGMSLPTEVDDLLLLITRCDEVKLTDKLPTFVSSDPDKMPSFKMTVGDMAMVMAKLSKFGEGLCYRQRTVDKNTTTVSRQVDDLGRIHNANMSKSSGVGISKERQRGMYPPGTSAILPSFIRIENDNKMVSPTIRTVGILPQLSFI